LRQNEISLLKKLSTKKNSKKKFISLYFQQNQKEVDAYLPDDIWYEFKDHDFVLASKIGHVKLTDRATGPPPTHFRGGSIIPFTKAESKISKQDISNTDIIRKNGLVLIVIPDKAKTASGDLFWDDGESIDTIESGNYNYYTFELQSNCSLEIDVIKSGCDTSSEPQVIERIAIFGINDTKIEASVDGEKTETTHKSSGISLETNIDLNSKKAGQKWVINWKSTQTNSCNIK
jgi:alpha-glucosidase (family GH31 glycosyl hydrolase)